MKLFGRKRDRETVANGHSVLSNPAASHHEAQMAAWEQERVVSAERSAQLHAELAALEPPADLYRIMKNFKDGSFTVSRWGKRIEHWFVGLSLKGSIISGYEPIQKGLPSKRAAEGWLKAYLDPTTNLAAYDAAGNRLDPSS